MEELGRPDLAGAGLAAIDCPKDHVQQHGARYHRVAGKVTRRRWMVGGEGVFDLLGHSGPTLFPEKPLKRLGGQLAGGIAGQGIDEVERARQESRFDPLAQPRQQRFGCQIGRHHEGSQPHRPPTLAGTLRHDEHAVADTIDRVEVMVEIGQRTALASDVDLIGGASVQDEAVGRIQFDYVGQQRFPVQEIA